VLSTINPNDEEADLEASLWHPWSWWQQKRVVYVWLMVGLAQLRNHPHSVELELWSPSNRTPSHEITNLAQSPMVSMMMQIDPLKPIYLIDIDFLKGIR
jgi:hypothetical protein